ncbi:MAG: PorT family protein [Saprospiraceae bacterium]|nr:PorT family protein [Saprospiraceae bacterium]
MKKLLIITLFLTAISNIHAQLSVGVVAGANLTYFKWHIKSLDTDLGYSPAPGFRAAGTIEWKFNPQFSLRSDIGAQIKSGALDIESNIGTGTKYGTIQQRFQYWEGSLLMHFSPFKSFNNFYFCAGLSGQYLTKAWAVYPDHLVEGDNPEKQDLDIEAEHYRKNMLSTDFGIGAKFPIAGKSGFKVELRHQYGLSDFSSHENVDAHANPFILQVGYVVGI